MKFQRMLSQPHVIFYGDIQPSSPQQPEGVWQRFVHAISKETFWQSLVKFATGSSAPVIKKRSDRTGKVSYTIYDPVSQEQSGWLSETEAREWLEQRYYQ